MQRDKLMGRQSETLPVCFTCYGHYFCTECFGIMKLIGQREKRQEGGAVSLYQQ